MWAGDHHLVWRLLVHARHIVILPTIGSRSLQLKRARCQIVGSKDTRVAGAYPCCQKITIAVEGSAGTLKPAVPLTRYSD